VGSASWIALAIGAVLFKKWPESVPLAAASPSVMAACLLGFGIVLVAFGLYGYRGHPSKQVIERWAELDGYMPMFAWFSAALPLGIAIAILGVLLLKPSETFVPWIMIPFTGLTFAGIVLLIWQPKWAKPPWLVAIRRTPGGNRNEIPMHRLPWQLGHRRRDSAGSIGQVWQLSRRPSRDLSSAC
jgi:hypothetical protein